MKSKDIFGNYTSVYGPAHWDEGEEGWLFIGLNTCEETKSDVTIPQTELDWLAQTLKKVNRDRPLALFAHHPFNPGTKAYRVINADDVLGLFAEHRLKLVAAGHFHGNQVEEQDGVLFTTTACCSTTRDNLMRPRKRATPVPRDQRRHRDRVRRRPRLGVSRGGRPVTPSFA